MKKTSSLATLLIFMSGLVWSCSMDQSVEGESTSTLERVLFQDDFSNDQSGWPKVRTDEGITDYQDGMYRILVNLENQDFFGYPGLSLQPDVRIEVDATKVAGSDDNDFGLLCRYQDNNNFYQFLISSDGYVGILKYVDGSMQNLGAETLLENDAVHTGNAKNHIRADCIGDTLTLYVNGEQVSTVTDTSFGGYGDVGVFAGTYDTPGTDIYFDNFVVVGQ